MLVPLPIAIHHSLVFSHSLLLQNKFGQAHSPVTSTCVMYANRCTTQVFGKRTEWIFWPKHSVHKKKEKSFKNSYQIEIFFFFQEVGWKNPLEISGGKLSICEPGLGGGGSVTVGNGQLGFSFSSGSNASFLLTLSPPGNCFELWFVVF
jgi:hypothetical protein